MKKRLVSRRNFMKGTAAAAASVIIIPSHALAGPNDKLNVACIGVGGKGDSDVRGVSGENVVALCDADDRKARGTFNRHPKAKKYRDFRKMLDEMGKEIDAVTVSTPDHVHFVASMMAIKMGKHVFTQKPLTHNILEARLLTAAARKARVATQMGIQGHSNQGPRRLVEWVESGFIGPVREIHYWTDRPVWPQGMGRPGGSPSIPSELSWDLWLGPAPDRPYHGSYLPFNWRGWWDFGCGALGDIGCHAFDAAFWALKLGNPERIEAQTTPVNNETAPRQSTVTYYFPKRGNMPPVKVVWYDGKRTPPRPEDLEEGRSLPGGIGGQLIFGDKATVMANTYCSSLSIIPFSKMKAMKSSMPPKRIPNSIGHVREWIEACKGSKKPPGANFDYAGALTEMVLLGNLAVRTGKTIEWDSKNMRVTNVPEANRFVSREPRREWREFYEDDRPKPKKKEKRKIQQPVFDEKKKREADANRLFSTARQAERFGQRSAARGLYKKIITDYADTDSARKAKARLKVIGE